MNTKELKEGDTVTIKARVKHVDSDGFKLETSTGGWNSFLHYSQWDVERVTAPVSYYKVLFLDYNSRYQVSDNKYKDVEDFTVRTGRRGGLQILESTKEIRYE